MRLLTEKLKFYKTEVEFLGFLVPKKSYKNCAHFLVFQAAMFALLGGDTGHVGTKKNIKKF